MASAWPGLTAYYPRSLIWRFAFASHLGLMVTPQPGNIRQLRNCIRMMVVMCDREKAAKILGIGERTLYRKIKEYDL